MQNIYNQTIALAGVMQALITVNALAFGKDLELNQLENTLKTVQVINPNSFTDVYNNELKTIKQGLAFWVEKTPNLIDQNKLILEYFLGVLKLEKKINNGNCDCRALGVRLSNVAQKNSRYDLDKVTNIVHTENDSGNDNSALDELVNELSLIYSQIISPIGSKILVKGKAPFITESLNQKKIRACLLAAIRSAILYRQASGRGYKVMLLKGQYAKQSQQILNSIAGDF